MADWAVLFYIAGDVENRQSRDREAKSLHDDLNEILKAGASREVRIAVQHDDPVKGARRFLLTERSNVNLEPVEILHKIDSGASDVLADFLRWGLSVCPAKRVALVLGGQSALAPSDSEQKGNHRGARVFTICRDDNAGGYMDVIELGTVIRKVLSEYGREQLEMLAIDSCQTQFLELAYELEGQVEVLLAPQYWVPTAGWNYTSVLQTWKKAARQHRDKLDTIFLARQLVPVIIHAYGQNRPNPKAEYFVSALDLRRLDDVARAFDTFCIGMLQVLGEGLIWKARSLVVSLLNTEIHPRKAKLSAVRSHNEDRLEAYDCGSLFAMLAASLEAMADESTQGWLGVALQRGSGEAFTRFRNVAAQSLEQFLRDNRDLNSRRRRERLRKWVQALRDKKPSVAGERMLKLVEKGIRDRVHLLHPDHFDAEAWKSRSDEAELSDRDLNQAIHEALRLLPEDSQVDYDRQLEAATSARRLAQQAKLAAKMLFGKELPELARNEPTEQDENSEDSPGNAFVVEDEKVSGMVVEVASTTGKTDGWPRWSGVSLYRPPELDGLMNESYQGFRFHQRIHWAALLGATNLIQSHPRALWRLVSSLLATGSAGTRRDLLQRLTGRDSVIWGLRDQFRVMAPAPTLTLSLEQQRKVRRPIKADSDKTKDRKRHQIKRSEEYVLRLESASGAAVINEQRSRVQPRVMDRALQELDELLGSPTINAKSLKKLTAIGGQLGDDIFQTLGNTLENARKVVSRESSFLAPHLQLQIPRKLMSYPWELMHHNGEWLSEQFAIGRQVFMETGMARSVSRRKRGRVHPLVIGDPLFDPQVANLGWRQLPGARFEAEQVAGWFERLRQEMGEVIDFERERDTRIHTHLTNHEFRDLLRHGDYDIIHFAGHGVFDPNDPETSAWMLSDGELWALEIRSTLANHPAPPWLVYANACEAGMESRSNVRKFQRNVFGLASAFLNQGVAAYIAPLWPIDDLLAQLISTNFYRQLLSERVTLGESLRRAKCEARRVAYPDDLELASDEEWASLGWASLVLYGDPTQELFQAIAGSEKTIQRSDSVRPIELSSAAMASRSGKSPVQQGRQCVHAPDRLLKEWVAGPAAINETKVAGTRGASKSSGLNLELIEESGLRRWRVASDSSGRRGQETSQPAHQDGLQGSPFAQLFADERLHKNLPGRRGVARVIWRWTCNSLSGGIESLIREYDADLVPNEGLLRYDATSKRLMPVQERLSLNSKSDRAPRALLVIHGLLSNTEAVIDDLKGRWLDGMSSRYAAILGLDHRTLSKDPEQNAAELFEMLNRYAPELVRDQRLDVVTHSRGGLVARAFCELHGHAAAVRNLVMVGTPNCGTDLANSKNWGRLADSLVNLSGIEQAKPIGYLAGFLARLAVMGVQTAAPGLMAMNPETAGVKNKFLSRLQQADRKNLTVRYCAVTADFEPTPIIPNLKSLMATAKSMGIDTATDSFFGKDDEPVANDLVVNTAHVWCVGLSPAEKQNLPKSFGKRVLVFVPPDTRAELPSGVRREVELGVNHFNMLANSTTQDAIRKWLSDL